MRMNSKCPPGADGLARVPCRGSPFADKRRPRNTSPRRKADACSTWRGSSAGGFARAKLHRRDASGPAKNPGLASASSGVNVRGAGHNHSRDADHSRRQPGWSQAGLLASGCLVKAPAAPSHPDTASEQWLLQRDIARLQRRVRGRLSRPSLARVLSGKPVTLDTLEVTCETVKRSGVKFLESFYAALLSEINRRDPSLNVLKIGCACYFCAMES